MVHNGGRATARIFSEGKSENYSSGMHTKGEIGVKQSEHWQRRKIEFSNDLKSRIRNGFELVNSKLTPHIV